MNKKLLDTIKKLSDLEGFRDVCHQHNELIPMPSSEVLNETVQLIRSILFPGYYGNADVNSKTMLYHIGVNVDRLMSLLTSQIKAGLSFDKKIEELPCPNELGDFRRDGLLTRFVVLKGKGIGHFVGRIGRILHGEHTTGIFGSFEFQKGLIS